MYEDLFLPSQRGLTPPSWGMPCDINAIYTSLKSTFSGLQFRCWQYGRLAVIASETWEMSRNSKRIWPYDSSRSSKVIDLGVNGKPICDFLLVINCNLSRICYRFWDIHADRKVLILPTPPLFDASARGNPLEFLDESYPGKTRGMGLPYGENFITPKFNRFSMIHPSDRRTDRWTGDSI